MCSRLLPQTCTGRRTETEATSLLPMPAFRALIDPLWPTRRQTGRPANRQADKPTGRQTDGPANSKPGKPAENPTGSRPRRRPGPTPRQSPPPAELSPKNTSAPPQCQNLFRRVLGPSRRLRPHSHGAAPPDRFILAGRGSGRIQGPCGLGEEERDQREGVHQGANIKRSESLSE